MKIKDYLSSKYEVKVPTSMRCSEARIFGIPYPLKSGWLEKYGDQEISQEAQKRLVESLSARKDRHSKRALALFDIQAHRQTVIEAKADRQHREKRKKTAEKVKKLQKKLAAPKIFPTTIEGVQVTSDAFLSTYEWRRVRMVALKKYGARCQCCGTSPADGAVMNVDHIKPRKLFPHLALNVDNLQILCHDCNHGKGNWDMTDWRPAEVDPEAITHLKSILDHG